MSEHVIKAVSEDEAITDLLGILRTTTKQRDDYKLIVDAAVRLQIARATWETSTEVLGPEQQEFRAARTAFDTLLAEYLLSLEGEQ